jgi:putative ABC transport system ATP-binding protein
MRLGSLWQTPRMPKNTADAALRPRGEATSRADYRLSVEGLRFRDYGPFDFGVQAGDCTTIAGASGSGKTLLLRSLADLDPHEGAVCVGGVECRALEAPVWRRRVGLLLAESHWWRERVGEHFSSIEPEVLAGLGFGEDVMEWSVGRLSTGERQRLAILRLLCNRPEVLLLDEATANLDDLNADRVEKRVARYREDSGAAVLWVTHDPAQALRVGTCHFRLEDGRLSREAPR